MVEGGVVRVHWLLLETFLIDIFLFLRCISHTKNVTHSQCTIQLVCDGFTTSFNLMLIPEYFHHSKKDIQLALTPYSLISLTLATTDLFFLVCQNFYIIDILYKWIIKYMSFGVWLLLLNVFKVCPVVVLSVFHSLL